MLDSVVSRNCIDWISGILEANRRRTLAGVRGYIVFAVIRPLRRSFVTSRVLLISVLMSVMVCHARSQTGSRQETVRGDLQRAQAALQANDQATAKVEFDAALKLDPANAEAHANLGMLDFFHGNCTSAEVDFRSALRVAPSLIKVEALLGVCEKRLGQPSAETDMNHAFDKLQDIKLRTQVGIELADFYYQRGDLGKTASVLYTLSSINPDNVDILFFEQRVYSEIANSTLDKLALLAPGSARMEQLIAEKLINDGDLKDATVHFGKALALNPKLAGVHFELAEALMEGSPNDAKVQKEASDELAAAIKVDGDSAKVQAELGRIAALQGDPDGALAHYRSADQLSPGDPAAEVGMADVLRVQKKPEEAAKYLRMAVTADPLNAEAHYKLSQLDKELGLDEEAKKELQLFVDIRASKQKVQALYQQMRPQ